MKTNYWSVAFTITMDGVQVDFMELQEQSRIVNILHCGQMALCHLSSL